MIKSKLMSGMTKENVEVCLIVLESLGDYYKRKAYKSKLMSLPLMASQPSKRQMEQLSHFAKQGVKVRLK